MIEPLPKRGSGVFAAYNAESKNVGDLLSDALRGRIVVPKFQRGYSWGKKHVEAFWDDIRRFQRESALKNGPDKYFLGPIVVMEDSTNKEIIYILDGQQRLATATILFSVMRDIAKEYAIQEASSFVYELQNHLIDKEDYGFCLEMGALDRAYFEETIQRDPPLADRKAKIRSHRNILKAREVLVRAVRAIMPTDPSAAVKELNALRRVVRGDLVMAAIPVKSQRDAFRIFETLNDRGLKLSVPDLLLNFLMGSATDDNDRDKIRAYWDQMTEGMGRKDIGQFLRHIWVSKYGDLKNQDLFTALKEHIEGKGIKSLDFAQTCSEECVRYVELITADKKELRTAAPYIETLVDKLGYEVTLPLLQSAHTLLQPADLEKVARWLLVFVTRYSLILGLDPSGLENTLYTLAREIRTQNLGTILSHIKDTLVRKAPNDQQMAAIKIDGEDLQFDQNAAVYLTARIATHMQTKTRELSLGNANLEHIFPKNPSADWTPDDKDALEPYLWHIGNLTMLGSKLNSAVGNAGFAIKRPYYTQNTELDMAQDVANKYTVWNVASVLKRASELVPLIIEIWNFDNPSRV